MTFHDRLTGQDTTPPGSAHTLSAGIQAPGGVETGGSVPTQGQGQRNAQNGGNSDTRAILGGIRFFVPGPPRGKGRPRAARMGKHIRLYTDDKTFSYESTVALAASRAMASRAPFEGPMSVVMRMRHPVPKSWSKRKREDALSDRVLPTVKCDADNCVKAVFDAINGIVWVDDVQVVELALTKRYAATPGVDVFVSQLKGSK